MKYGIRKPNIKKRISARTTGKAKRAIKKSINPLYGKKGMGMINNPKKAIYNKVYNRTTISVDDIAKNALHRSNNTTKHSTNPNTHRTSSSFTPTNIEINQNVKVDINKLKKDAKLWLILTIVILLLSIVFNITGIFAIVASIICWTKYKNFKRGREYEEKNT